jgi:hypothetical protein
VSAKNAGGDTAFAGRVPFPPFSTLSAPPSVPSNDPAGNRHPAGSPLAQFDPEQLLADGRNCRMLAEALSRMPTFHPNTAHDLRRIGDDLTRMAEALDGVS